MNRDIEMLAFLILRALGDQKTDKELLHSIKDNAELYNSVCKVVEKEEPRKPESVKAVRRPC